jgi:hypothetical protein
MKVAILKPPKSPLPPAKPQKSIKLAILLRECTGRAAYPINSASAVRPIPFLSRSEAKALPCVNIVVRVVLRNFGALEDMQKCVVFQPKFAA